MLEVNRCVFFWECSDFFIPSHQIVYFDMKKLVLFLSLAAYSLMSVAETDSNGEKNYKGTFYNKEYHVRMKMNLERADIPVPGMEDLDSCYGYIEGRVNGMWLLLKVMEKTDKKAVVRAVSERGADAQNMEMKLTETGISVKLINGTYLKGVGKNKYVKLPKPMELEKE